MIYTHIGVTSLQRFRNPRQHGAIPTQWKFKQTRLGLLIYQASTSAEDSCVNQLSSYLTKLKQQISPVSPADQVRM